MGFSTREESCRVGFWTNPHEEDGTTCTKSKDEEGEGVFDSIFVVSEMSDSICYKTTDDTWKKSTLKGGSYEMRPLLVPIFLGGKLVYNCPSVEEIKAHCKKEQESLWEECRRLTNPHAVHVDLSDKLYEMKKQLLTQYSRGE